MVRVALARTSALAPSPNSSDLRWSEPTATLRWLAELEASEDIHASPSPQTELKIITDAQSLADSAANTLKEKEAAAKKSQVNVLKTIRALEEASEVVRQKDAQYKTALAKVLEHPDDAAFLQAAQNIKAQCDTLHVHMDDLQQAKKKAEELRAKSLRERSEAEGALKQAQAEAERAVHRNLGAMVTALTSKIAATQEALRKAKVSFEDRPTASGAMTVNSLKDELATLKKQKATFNQLQSEHSSSPEDQDEILPALPTSEKRVYSQLLWGASLAIGFVVPVIAALIVESTRKSRRPRPAPAVTHRQIQHEVAYTEIELPSSDMKKQGMVMCIWWACFGFFSLALVVVPWVGQASLTCSNGLSWEFHLIMAVVIVGLRCIELWLYSKVLTGPRLGYGVVSKCMLLGSLSAVDIYMDVVFVYIARACESPLWVASLMALVLGYIGIQFIGIVNWGDTSKCGSRRRKSANPNFYGHWKAMHCDLVCALLDVPDTERKRNNTCAAMAKFACEDFVQVTIQLLFLRSKGLNPQVCFSVAVGCLSSALAICCACCEDADED